MRLGKHVTSFLSLKHHPSCCSRLRTKELLSTLSPHKQARPCQKKNEEATTVHQKRTVDTTPERSRKRLSDIVTPPRLEARAGTRHCLEDVFSKVDHGMFGKGAGVNEGEKVGSTEQCLGATPKDGLLPTQLDDEDEVEEITTPCASTVDLTSRLVAMEERNEKMLRFLHECFMASSSCTAALPSSTSVGLQMRVPGSGEEHKSSAGW